MHLKTSNPTANRARPFTVNFPLPRKAVSKLRALAIGKDHRLLDLGVLAVQISDDESIVLGIELDKTKKKSAEYVNKAASSPYAHSSDSRVSFNVDPRSFTTTSSFDPLTRSYSGAYATQLLQAARNDKFVTKAKKTVPAQNSAAKRRAKETLNAAKRGRGRGRAGKSSGQLINPSIRASTWEMVYSHIGLPGERRNKATKLLEPPVGSQASGIANVPVAQTELPKESISKTERRRKNSASSPPLKSPGQSGVYSEDDSSVSSSPCSHSPMNSEELMNLFVDTSFSATSVLKQLAESRSKEEEKQIGNDNNNDKTNKSFGNGGADGHPKMKESGSSLVDAAAFDSTPQWGTFPKNSGTPVPNIENINYTSDSKTSKPVKGVENSFAVGPSINQNFSLSTSSVSTSSAAKRPSSMLVESYSGSSHLNTKPLPDSQPKRARTEVELKREKINLNKANEKNLQKSPDCPTSQLVSQPVTSFGHHFSNCSMTEAAVPATTTTNVAIRNYLQYGYYYSSEDLNRALAKGSKSKSTAQTSLYTSTSSSNRPIMSIASNSNAVMKLKIQNEQPTTKEPAFEVSSSSFTSQQSISNQKNSDFPDSEGIDASKMAITPTPSADVNEISSQSLAENSTSQKSPCEASTMNMSSVCRTPTVTVTTSSPPLKTSSDTTQLRSTATNSGSNIQSNGKCYAISYVYPMGTVWYPYVAITPYAMLQKEAREPEKKTRKKEKMSGAYDTSSQYIDLASSLRYWQQLSLLYKNQMVVTASASTNTLGSSLSTLGQNATGVSSSLTPTPPSDLSKQSTAVSMIDSKSERAPFSFSLSESSSSITSSFSKQPSQDVSSNSSGSSEKKPVRRASVIVAAKTSNTVSSSRANSTESLENRSSSSTPESDSSTDPMQIRSDPLVIDNCNRLIEEHCQRMNEVLASPPGDHSGSLEERASSSTPSLSFIPDSSIAYVNVGNNNGSKKTGKKFTFQKP